MGACHDSGRTVRDSLRRWQCGASERTSAGRVSFQFVRPAVGLLAARWQDICLPPPPLPPLALLTSPLPLHIQSIHQCVPNCLRPACLCLCLRCLPRCGRLSASVSLCVPASSVVVVVTLLVVVVLTVVACFRFSTEIKKFSIFRAA